MDASKDFPFLSVRDVEEEMETTHLHEFLRILVYACPILEKKRIETACLSLPHNFSDSIDISEALTLTKQTLCTFQNLFLLVPHWDRLPPSQNPIKAEFPKAKCFLLI